MNKQVNNMNAAEDYLAGTSQLTFVQKLRRNLRPVVRGSAHKHDPLLINSLAAFNFRPPIMLEFPGERLVRSGAFPR